MPVATDSESRTLASEVTQEMRHFYETSDTYFHLIGEDSSDHQSRMIEMYASLLDGALGAGASILDLGCGRATSTRRLVRRGRPAVGVDLSFHLLHGSGKEGDPLPLVVARADQLPFRDGSFEGIGMNNLLEHVADVPAVLREVERVTASGGKILIISPNLLTPLRPLKALLGGGKGSVSLTFYGGRLGALGAIVGQGFWLLQKRLSRRARFLYRSPDLQRFEKPDDDAVYLCTPLDLMRWFQARGCSVRRLPPILAGRHGLAWLKDRLAFRLPGLDKGFCLLIEKPRTGGEGPRVA